MVRLALALSTLLAGPALAQTAAPAAPTTEAAPAKPKLACRREVPTGSIMMGKKVCHTAEEWRVIDGAGADNVDRFRNSNHGRMGPTGL